MFFYYFYIYILSCHGITYQINVFLLESKTMPSGRKVEAMQDSIGSSTEVDVQKPGSEEERMSDERRFLDDEVLV